MTDTTTSSPMLPEMMMKGISNSVDFNSSKAAVPLNWGRE